MDARRSRGLVSAPAKIPIGAWIGCALSNKAWMDAWSILEKGRGKNKDKLRDFSCVVLQQAETINLARQHELVQANIMDLVVVLAAKAPHYLSLFAFANYRLKCAFHVCLQFKLSCSNVHVSVEF